MARDVVHGLLCYQGLDIQILYIEQMLAQLGTLLQYGPQEEDVTGSLIQYAVEAFWLEVGINWEPDSVHSGGVPVRSGDFWPGV